MSKTYSVAIQVEDGTWITNWHKYFSLDDINWQEVEEFCKQKGYLAYGYYHGCQSNECTSSRCRTMLKKLEAV